MLSCCNLMLQNFYMFRAMEVHHQEVSWIIQVLWYSVMTKYAWNYDESSVCIIYGVEKIHWSFNKRYYKAQKGK